MSPSLRARLMNRWLRFTEKAHLARTTDITKLRRSFELKAKLNFHAPWGSRIEEAELAGLRTLKIRPKAVPNGKTILYFHGGAFVMGSPQTHSAMLANLCKKAGCTALLVTYRRAPENKFPAPVEDAIAAYKAHLASGASPQDTVIGGDSAGGCIAFALLGEITRLGLPQPAGTFALSPLTDVSFSGASVAENEGSDVVLPADRVKDLKALYLADADTRDPRCSPLFGNYTGANPVFIAVGDTEILRDDGLRMAETLRAQTVPVTLALEHDLPHVWPLFHGYFPEAGRTLSQIATWIKALPAPAPES